MVRASLIGRIAVHDKFVRGQRGFGVDRRQAGSNGLSPGWSAIQKWSKSGLASWPTANTCSRFG